MPTIFQDGEILHGKSIIDAEFLNNQLFPDMIPNILKWMCKGDSYLHHMDSGKRDVFKNLCKSQYDFEPDHKNIKAIAEKLGAQRSSWKYVWQLYATAPHKYPEIEDLLRLAKPVDLGAGIFSFPEESWPQVNEKQEEELGVGLTKAAKHSAPQIPLSNYTHYLIQELTSFPLKKTSISKCDYRVYPSLEQDFILYHTKQYKDYPTDFIFKNY